MHSPLAAMTWQYWGRHRWGLAAVAACALGLAAVLPLLPDGTLEPTHGALCSVPVVFGLVYLAAVFCHGFECRLEVQESGFPAWQFTLPARTRILVGWPMLQGVAAVAALAAVWAYLILPASGWDPPTWLPAMVAALLAVLQALVWSPFPLPWARVVTAVVVLTSLLLLSPMLESFHGLSQQVFLVAVACLVPAAYAAAVVGVNRSRHGGASAGAWAWPRRTTTASSVPRPRRPFASAARAQLWFEWRRHGLTFPIIAAGHSVLFLGLLWLVDTPQEELRLGWSLVFFPMLVAPMAAASLGAGRGDEPFRLSAFIATRPLTTAALVGSTVKATVLSALAGWALQLPAALAWCLDTGFHRTFGAWWEQQLRDGNAMQAGALVLLALAAPVVLSISAIVGNLFIGFTGRRWVVYGIYFIAAGILIPFLWGVSWLLNHPERHAEFAETLPGWLTGAVMAKAALAAWALLALRRRGLATGRNLAALVGCWALAAAGLTALVWWAVPEGLAPRRPLAFGVILALPLARLALAPLALEWNRHR